MKSLLFLSFVGLLMQPVKAQIQGPKSGATFTIEAIPGANQTWINPGNAAASDDAYSSFGNITGGVGSYTDYLVATNFGFTIPIASSITGIIVEVERADPNFRTSDYRIRIVKGGVTSTSERSVGSGFPFSDSYQSYGNAGDLWGETWTDADINSTGFGVAVAAQRSVAGSITTGRIDHIRIIVFYNFTTLPVRLINFSAVPKNKIVQLTWVTAEELNMLHYEVERSFNARDYTSLKNVTSHNQLQQATYSCTDDTPEAGLLYYRLKTVENTGTVKYSKVVSVQFSRSTAVTVYPQLWKTGEALSIKNLGSEKMTILFYNLTGHQYGAAIINGNSVPTSPIEKAKGLVFYKITKASGNTIAGGKLIVNQ